MDPDLIPRLEQQLKAKEEAIVAYSEKIQALSRQIEALQQSLEFKRRQVDNKLRQSNMKVKIDSAGVQAALVDEKIARDQFDRMKALYNKQLEPLTKLEERQNKFQAAAAKRIEAENKLLVSQADVLNAQIEQSAVVAEYMDKISKARSDKSTAEASLYDAQALVAKLRNELAGNRIRAGYYYITSPQSGYVVKALKAGVGEQIKEGEGICTIMPDGGELAVEVFVRAMDVPLLSKGRTVRLQFDGWPAIQFSGWPSVAIGTFGGRIHVIDYINSPGGYYRVLVKMDTLQDENWPRQLRVGSGVYAWALLDDVPVIYEIWRQLNGFPPALNNMPDMVPDKKNKEKSEKQEDEDSKAS
jgi:multidrug resistance efflux pump